MTAGSPSTPRPARCYARTPASTRTPNVPGLDAFPVSYIKDLARFPTVTQARPRFSGPTLLLNGENNLETPPRAAIAADAAVAAAGNQDHKVVIYRG
ncbi:hypothetical protein [Paractinoplanes hotanensis]|uniref:Uncharacterized protein n=1 Tax=Paractinoplanes hotanensis TaxID=2906497 RepID=A0ABT0Y1M8_9ACTN|nr:hypothetical protein [Actinoplanes hotanensis]MCM4079249.1 hypothetical protein [Actinoplanes hotanensis]